MGDGERVPRKLRTSREKVRRQKILGRKFGAKSKEGRENGPGVGGRCEAPRITAKKKATCRGNWPVCREDALLGMKPGGSDDK